MTPERYDFGFVGGDMRQVYCARILADKGYRICAYGMSESADCVSKAESLDSLAEGSRAIVGPIPLTKNQKDIFSTSENLPAALGELCREMKKGQCLYAGCIPQRISDEVKQKGADVYDFMKDEALTLYNTIATAEGAIAEAISNSPENLGHSSCLVLGYGRCARTLCAYLKGMFCNVTVCARRPEARAMASIISDDTISPEELNKYMGQYSFIFNTVPCRMIDRSLLEKMPDRGVIIDLASAPGGVDYEAAKELNRKACLCLGLPGKYAPGSSGKMIAVTLIQLTLSKEGAVI